MHHTYISGMTAAPDADLATLLARVRACRECANALPLPPRPILHMAPTARILIASQAPGTKAHAAGISFADPSGDRLRAWMGVSAAEFYDESRIAIVPMGLCYPGRLPAGGDAPPRRECARLWRDDLLAHLPNLQLTLLIGTYAQQHVLGPGNMSARVEHFRDTLPAIFPLPHPSWRTRAWAARRPWFEADVLPELRRLVREVLDG